MKLRELIAEDIQQEVDVKNVVKKGYEKVKNILTPKPVERVNPLQGLNVADLKVAIERVINGQPLEYPHTSVLKQLYRKI